MSSQEYVPSMATLEIRDLHVSVPGDGATRARSSAASI